MNETTSVSGDATGAFRAELQSVINRHSAENGSNTPDFILANYLYACLLAFDAACRSRDDWYGHRRSPGGVEIVSQIGGEAMADGMVKAGKRLAIHQEGWDGWWTSYSPRNDNNNAEGQWCQWVHLARMILADERTRTEMPSHYREYPNPPRLYDEPHPDCVPCAAKAETQATRK